LGFELNQLRGAQKRSLFELKSPTSSKELRGAQKRSLFQLKSPDVLRPACATWFLPVRPHSVFPSVVVQLFLQLLSLLLLCFLVPLLVNVCLEALGPTVWIVALQNVYQVMM